MILISLFTLKQAASKIKSDANFISEYNSILDKCLSNTNNHNINVVEQPFHFFFFPLTPIKIL